MKEKTGLVLGILSFLLLIGATSTFGQEAAVSEQAMPESQTEPQTQWLWGEVISVDTKENQLLVKYLDYEADQEKEVNIGVDDKTTYESIGSLAEIKPQDAVSIDYILSPEGKNIAKNISVERPETLPEDLQSP